jgi:phosphate transport system substrate-binding protein
MINLGAAWSEAFMKKFPGRTIAVQGGGSGTGLNALINKNTDVAQSSRPITGDELAKAKTAGVLAKEIIVAYDGVGMVVNPKNKVSELTVEQLARIYRGEITNWKLLGGDDAAIVVLARDTASGTHVFIKEHVVQEQGKIKTAEYGKNVQFLTSNQAIATEVSQNSRAIGYVGLGYLTDKVKAVKVKKDAQSAGVSPSVETVKNKTYELSRPLFFYTATEPAGIMKDFVEWVLGPEGQALVLKLDFVPVK